MSALKKYTPFFASAILMCMALYIIYPHYQYYIDPDGTAYLTISKRYAAGDFQRAVNGYWSPWACWLTAFLIRAGMSAIPASVVINSLGAIGFLYISQSFFLRFSLIRKVQWLFGVILVFFLCYAVFWQSFDDLWECFFLLCTLRLMLAEAFVNKPVLWVATGALGTIAYFAKAYSFPFFILNTFCCTYFLCKENKAQWIKISFVSVGVMILCSLPWIWALHNKYAIWTISTSGSLNMSWYLVGHPYWKQGIDALVPPVYPDSPYYWEDPWFANGMAPHFWDSWHLFGLQLLRLGLNIWKFVVSSFQLSVFFIVIIGYVKWVLIWKRGGVLAKDIRVVMLSLLLFTLGYVLVNFEARYLWYMVPLSMVMGALYIQRMEHKGLQKILPFVFALSFLLYPAFGMVDMYDQGKNEYADAVALRQCGIKGAFTTYPLSRTVARKMERLAYFSGIQYYSIPKPDSCTQKYVLAEMRRYHVKYYFVYGTPDMSTLVDENGNSFPEITNGRVAGLKVFLVNP